MGKTYEVLPSHAQHGKHQLLRKYLPAWAKVLSRSKTPPEKLVYVDGFAYKGRYDSSETGDAGVPGSPLVAIECLRGAEGTTTPVVVTIEQKAEYYADLKRVLETLGPDERGKVDVRPPIHGAFADHIHRIMDRAKHYGAPTFVFIDPFGPSGFPIETVRTILDTPRSEVLINLMWVLTALSMTKADTQHHFTEMFGDESWRSVMSCPVEDRGAAYLQAYMNRLRSRSGAAAKIVRSLEVRSYEGNIVYWLVFCTNSEKGWQEMKRAMWQVAPSDGARFHDTTVFGQDVLFQDSPDLQQLRRQLLEHFKGRLAVRFDEVERFVLLETAFDHTSHLNKRVLVPLEAEGIISVIRPEGGRGMKGATINFP